MNDDRVKHAHYFLDPSSQGLDDLLEGHLQFPTCIRGGGGKAAVQYAEPSASNTPRALSLSIVEPDQEAEAKAREVLSGDALNAWQRSAPRRALSNALKRMRTEKKLSQKQVAKTARVTQSDIARMESSSGPWPNQAKLAAYAKACGMQAVIGFIDASDCEEESAINIVLLGGAFGERSEELISVEDFLSAQKRGKNFMNK